MAKTKMTHQIPVAVLCLFSLALAPAGERDLVSSSQASQNAPGVPGPREAEIIAMGADLRLIAGKSLVVPTDHALKGISLADPAVANASAISSNKILLNGLKVGRTTLLYWDEQLRVYGHNLDVLIDLDPLRNRFQALFPEQKILISQSGGALVLSGTVSSPEAAARAEALAKTEGVPVVNMLNTPGLSDATLDSLRSTLSEIFPNEKLQLTSSAGALVLYGTPSSPGVAARAEALLKAASKDVVNMLDIPHISDVVSLKVRIAEVQRSALQELGLHVAYGGKNSAGSSVSQKGTGNFVTAQDPAAGRGIANADFQLTDVIQLFLFQPDTDLSALIKAFVQRNLAQILAEPNLLAISGKEASFLAGGELPIPIAQGGVGGTLTFTILWKEFGVRLKFIADVLGKDLIHIKVAPEVSSLDFTNGVSLPGSVRPIPAIATRKAETEVELLNGQSFAIAGLIDNRLIENAAKIPGLGDIPILGSLFRSRAYQRNNTELLVLVTPQLVKPPPPDQLPLSSFPAPFIDKEKFDRGFDGQKKNVPGNGANETPRNQ